MIRLDLWDLINRHKPIEELNNNNTNNNNNNNNTDHGEWKIYLSIIISCISTKILTKNAPWIQKIKQ